MLVVGDLVEPSRKPLNVLAKQLNSHVAIVLKNGVEYRGTMVKCDGQVMIIGVTGEPAGISEQQIVRMEREIKGTFVYTEDDILLCLDFLAQRRFNTEGMVSDIISLDDIVEKGFERLAATPSLIKIIVAP